MNDEPRVFDPALCADLLVAARRSGRALVDVPETAVPPGEDEAILVQDIVARTLGTVVAWKVGAATPDATPVRAPIHADTVFVEPVRVAATRFREIGVEAEIVYRLGADLPPRASPYSRDEVLAAVASMHPAIEICDTRFAHLSAQPPLLHRADQVNHGALIVGPAQTLWRDIDAVNQPVRLALGDTVISDTIGGNSAGDPVRLLVWLVNFGAHPHGGLRAGQYVTTGSCTGNVLIEAPTEIVADFPGIGRLDVLVD